MRKLLFAFLSMAAACSSNNSPMTGDDDGSGSGDDGSGSGSGVPTAQDIQQDYDDVATSIGSSLVAGDFGSQVDAVNMAFGRMPAGFTQTVTPTYVLLDGQRNGLVVEYKLYCRDTAANNVPCDGLEYEAHVRNTYSGSVDATAASMDGVQRVSAWIVRNVQLPTPLLGGTGTNTLASHLATGDYSLTISDTLDKVAFQSTPVGPLGGQILLMLTVDRNRPNVDPVDRNFAVVANVKFTGTDNAIITLDTTHIYTLTLSTGTVTAN